MLLGGLHFYVEFNFVTPSRCNLFKVNIIIIITIGRWLDKQRQRQRNKILCDEEEVLLQTLVDDGRLKWRLTGTVVADDSKWIEMYDVFLKHGQETNNYNLKKNFKIVDPNFDSGESVVFSVGLWLNTQVLPTPDTFPLLPYPITLILNTTPLTPIPYTLPLITLPPHT
jgi:hypothetical protein